MTPETAPRIHAVVVSWRPDAGRLARQFAALLPQVDAIVWVDNGSAAALPRDLVATSDRIQLTELPENIGLGAAQNRGAEIAVAAGATHVLLMDDDSVPQAGMVAALWAALDADKQAAAAGPFYQDPKRAERPAVFARTEGWRVVRQPCHGQVGAVPVDYTIASGLLIDVGKLAAVGPMRGDFFIEWIDIEWCWRAQTRGFRVLGVCAAHMEHRFGDRMIRVAWRQLPLHPPWRHYYQARNLVLMLKSLDLPRPVRWRFVARQSLRGLCFSLLVPPRWQYARMWALGLWHGWRGKSGALIQP